MQKKTKAKLILEDGSVYQGYSFGFERHVSGEVVFNTGMVGYPETLTDPSYRGQILTLTYPLIGNYGVPGWMEKDGIPLHFESDRIQITALIVSDYSFNHNHWNSRSSLSEWLRKEKIPALYGIDTRKLTKHLREKGVMLGKIVFEHDIKIEDPNKRNLVAEVSVEEPSTYGDGKKRIVLVDCGVKNNIIRSFLSRNVQVIRVPWDYDFFKLEFDGLFISNGPGDPKMCKATIKNLTKAIDKNIPTFGICLGNQLLALAAGGDTYKLKYGHRSQNQPCINEETKRCYITSQNHGFAVDTKSLPGSWKPYFTNANDKTNEGIKHEKKPIFSSQFHPEATPGPVDTGFLFDEFLKMIK